MPDLELIISEKKISNTLPIEFVLPSSALGKAELEYFVCDYLIVVSRKKDWEITYKELLAICTERTQKGFYHTTHPYDYIVETTAQELIQLGYFEAVGIDNKSSSQIIRATEKLKNMLKNH